MLPLAASYRLCKPEVVAKGPTSKRIDRGLHNEELCLRLSTIEFPATPCSSIHLATRPTCDETRKANYKVTNILGAPSFVYGDLIMWSDAPTDALPTSSEYYDLGSFTRPISTRSSEAQVWFNRGLTWAYSFNHGEARKCFEQVIIYDPGCAMGYWGIAFVSGPNYNKTWKIFDRHDREESLRVCQRAMHKAQSCLATTSSTERALIQALQYRYPDICTADDLDGLSNTNLAYARSMRDVWNLYKDSDLDVVALFADALMNTAPWKLYNVSTGLPARSSPALEIKDVLDRGFRMPSATTHPGLLHMHIHLLEMSSTPEAALPSADRLRNLVPDAGHMHHMPTHIDVLVGNYKQAIESNWKATIVDDRYFAREGGQNFYSFYRLHNYHSLIYAAMLAGRSGTALEAVDRMEATITTDMLRITSPPMADWLESFMSIRIHVMVRFGLWDELKRMRLPSNQELYCVTTTMTHYGRGLAFAATKKTEKAIEERELFRAALQRVPNTRLDFPNKVVDILRIATAMLDGEIEYRLGNFTVAFERLREAISIDDSLHYSEPWGWMLPTRHPYAALLLEQGHVKEAASAYEEDLGLRRETSRAHRHPDNVWALHGYHECLLRLGRSQECEKIQQKLQVATSLADVAIRSSCYCRLKTMPKGA